MRAVNVTVVGNLTGDPELKFTSTGLAVVRFSLAHNPRSLDKTSGEWKDGEPTYYRCTAWRQLAENVAECLVKGHRVLVYGAIAERRWKDQQSGEDRSAWDLTAEHVAAELSHATVAIKKLSRNSRGELPPDDPWATSTPAPPPGDDAPPF